MEEQMELLEWNMRYGSQYVEEIDGETLPDYLGRIQFAKFRADRRHESPGEHDV